MTAVTAIAPGQHRPPWSEEQVATLIKLRGCGTEYSEIAIAMGITVASVSGKIQYLRRTGTEVPSKRYMRCLGKCGKSFLTTREIRICPQCAELEVFSSGLS